jgi:RNA polymerase sigma-32 factor
MRSDADLVRAHRAGNRAAGNELARRYVRLVHHIGRRCLGADGDTIVSAGLEGLAIAIRKWDPRGARLSTYAGFWIRACILKAVSDAHSVVRCTYGSGARFFGLRRQVARMAARLGVSETSAEIAEIIACETGSCVDVMRARIAHAMSFDSPEPTCTISESASPEDAAIDAEESPRRAAAVQGALDTLPPRWARIARARLMSDPPRTHADIGRELGISRERVRQIDIKVRAALREALEGVGE